MGRNIVRSALVALGARVELKEDHFFDDEDDTVWVPSVGQRGWIILTRDSRLRHNHLELIALMKAGTHSFILTSAEQTGPDMARAVTVAHPTMLALIAKFRPPFVGTITASGAVNVHFTHDQLIELISGNEREAAYRAALRKPRRP